MASRGGGFDAAAAGLGRRRSKRSRSITLVHARAKSTASLRRPPRDAYTSATARSSELLPNTRVGWNNVHHVIGA